MPKISKKKNTEKPCSQLASLSISPQNFQKIRFWVPEPVSLDYLSIRIHYLESISLFNVSRRFYGSFFMGL